jgi:hypothetical protein
MCRHSNKRQQQLSNACLWTPIGQEVGAACRLETIPANHNKQQKDLLKRVKRNKQLAAAAAPSKVPSFSLQDRQSTY